MKREVTIESVRNDAANVLGFLRALEAGSPTSVDPDLVGLLEGALNNPLALNLLRQTIASGVNNGEAKR